MKLRQLALLVMTDPAGADALGRSLRACGFELSVASNARNALRSARATPPDVVVAEPTTKDAASLDLRRELAEGRSTADVPVLTVLPHRRGDVLEFAVHPDTESAYATDARQVARLALDLARPRTARLSGEVYRSRLLSVDTAAHRVFVAGDEVILTAIEFRLLVALLSAAGRVLTREQLLRDVWGIHGHDETRTIDTHMKRLRRKLGAARSVVETVRTVGYRFRETPDRAGANGKPVDYAGAKTPTNAA